MDTYDYFTDPEARMITKAYRVDGMSNEKLSVQLAIAERDGEYGEVYRSFPTHPSNVRVGYGHGEGTLIVRSPREAVDDFRTSLETDLGTILQEIDNGRE